MADFTHPQKVLYVALAQGNRAERRSARVPLRRLRRIERRRLLSENTQERSPIDEWKAGS